MPAAHTAASPSAAIAAGPRLEERPAGGSGASRREREIPSAVIEAGGMIVLAGRALVRGLRGPYDYMPEFVRQFRFVLTLALLPLLLTAFALSFGPAGIQASGFLGLLGALDRLGSTFELIVVREFAPLVTAIVVAGVAGTAICADLGARKVREELDALSVLGVDVIRGLVVPRLFALTLAAMTFNVFALAAGIGGAVVVTIENHAPVGPFFSTFFAAANTTELAASFLKCAIYGAVIAVVCCYKGMAASGGAEGVGRAVNQAVVISFLCIGAIDYVFTQLLLATHPWLSAIR
jgi:phospholipid/cholesterol/gamma-HCH transport system permease protein